MNILSTGTLKPHDLGHGAVVWVGKLPPSLEVKEAQFEELWRIHPPEHAVIKMVGRLVKIPRWQQAYGMDYQFSGGVSKALPVPSLMEPFLTWSKETIDPRLNGLLVNWYDGALNHYIGPHRDSIANMVSGAPIVTISFGQERVFRLRRWKAGKSVPPVDVPVSNGSVLVMPYETNLAFTHEVPASKKHLGRRVSVTLRGFKD